jgi:hypothetical protein
MATMTLALEFGIIGNPEAIWPKDQEQRQALCLHQAFRPCDLG